MGEGGGMWGKMIWIEKEGRGVYVWVRGEDRMWGNVVVVDGEVGRRVIEEVVELIEGRFVEEDWDRVGRGDVGLGVLFVDVVERGGEGGGFVEVLKGGVYLLCCDDECCFIIWNSINRWLGLREWG